MLTPNVSVMMDLLEVAAVCALLIKRKKKRVRRKYWVHPIISERLSCGSFYSLFTQLKEYPDKFFCLLSNVTRTIRSSPNKSWTLHKTPGHNYEEECTCWREACSNLKKVTESCSTKSGLVWMQPLKIVVSIHANCCQPQLCGRKNGPVRNCSQLFCGCHKKVARVNASVEMHVFYF